MSKIKVKYIGTTDYRFSHGNYTETFTPGEIKEVDEYIGDILLRRQRTESKWKKVKGKKTKSLASSTKINLFELAEKSGSENTGTSETEESDTTETEETEENDTEGEN